MAYFKKSILLLWCVVTSVTGSIATNVLADGYGNTASTGTPGTDGGEGGAPCLHCRNCDEEQYGTGPQKAFFYNGSEYIKKMDLILPGVMPVKIQRIYNNQATFDSPLGYGWDFSFNERLRTYKDNSIVIRNQTGRKLHFVYTGGGYICEEDPNVTLLHEADGTFEFFVTPLGIHRYYDRNGRLIRKEDRDGHSLRFLYSANLEPLIGMSPNSIAPDESFVVSNNYQLQRIEQWDAEETFTGRAVDFTYDGNNGRLLSVGDSTGRTVGYQHDTQGNLIRVDFPENLFVSYQYTDIHDPHNMTNNLRGHGTNAPVLQVTRSYDEEDRLTREEYAGGVLDIDYAIPLLKTKVTKTIVDQNRDILHPPFDTYYEFNTDGYLVQQTDSERSVEFVRDSRHNITQRILWENTGTASSPNLVMDSAKSYTFDYENKMKASSVSLDSGEEIITEYGYDHEMINEVLTYSTMQPDRVHKTIIEYNHEETVPTTIAAVRKLVSINTFPVFDSIAYKYNTDGLLSELVFDNGDTVQMTYSNGLLTGINDNIRTYDGKGNIIADENGNGNVTQYEYDNFSRITKVINPLAEETIFTYTGWNLTRVEIGKTATLSGRIFNFSFDDFGRLVQSSLLDSSNSPVQQTIYTYDSDGHILAVEDQNGNKTTTNYDQWGRLVSSMDKDGNTTSYEHSITGRTVKTINPLQQNKTYEYDKLDRLTKITNPEGGTTSYYYDEIGKVVKVVDAESREFAFGYDLAGQLVLEKTPASDFVRYEYDSKGRLIKKLLPDGTYNTYSYNSKNKIEEACLAVGTPSYTTLRYGYDKVGNLLWYSDSSMGMEPQFSLTYDKLNRLISKTLVAIQKTMEFTYTPRGQRARLTLLDGDNELFHYSYSYDEIGRPLSLVQEQQSTLWTTGFTFDGLGMLVNKTYSNGVTEALTYTGGGLLSSIQYKKSDNTEMIEQFQYTHDSLARLTEITDTQGTATFSYDMHNRLIKADYPFGSNLTDENFTYDLTGNRLTSTAITDWSYDEGGKLISYDGHSLSYDIMGRQTGVSVGTETKIFEYDNLDRITKIQNGSSTSNYQYNYTNRRVKKTVDNNSTWYLHDGVNLIAEFDQSGQLARNFMYTPDSYDLLSITEGNVSYSILTNHHKMPIYALDDRQSTLWHGLYQSFGLGIIDNDVDGDDTSFEISHRFPGQYSDAETGLYYNWFRSYNAETGRYISLDPIKLAGGVNLFSYVQNNPINSIDPEGLLGYPEHFLITYIAARDSGLPFSKSFWLALDTAMVDFADGADGKDRAATRQHLMAGTINPEGKTFQTKEEGIVYGREYIQESLRYGNLFRALHAGQDLATPLHQGEKWDGGFHWDRESFIHIWEDIFPSRKTVKDAYKNTYLMINNSWEKDKLFNDRRIKNRQSRQSSQDCPE